MLELTPKIAVNTKDKRQQPQKKIHIGKYRKGLKLFALDIEKQEVYEVVVENQTDFDLSKARKVSSYKASINPKHPIMWCLNIKNAQRKFVNLVAKHY